MAVVFEKDPTISVDREIATDQEPQPDQTLSAGEILEKLGARLDRSPSAIFFASAFIEVPMCWIGVTDVLRSPFRDLIVEQTGVNNDKAIREMFFDATQELRRIEFVQSRHPDLRKHRFESTQFRYNPKFVEKQLAELNAERTRKAGNVALSEAEDSSWQDRANCRGVDPDLFFPERGASTREPKEVCRGCVVRLDCLEYALSNNEKFGIWGGLSEQERRRLRRQRSLSARRAEA